MQRIQTMMAALRERGVPPHLADRLQALHDALAVAQPDILDRLAAIPPEPPREQPGDAAAEAWCLELLTELLETREAPAACLWMAMHFAAFVAMRAAWARPGVQPPAVSPFVYAMQ